VYLKILFPVRRSRAAGPSSIPLAPAPVCRALGLSGNIIVGRCLQCFYSNFCQNLKMASALIMSCISFLLAYSAATQFPNDQLQEKEAIICCVRPCLNCTDPMGDDWVEGREYFYIKNGRVDQTVKGQWIAKRYTAGTRYYFVISRQDYENGLQRCKEMGFPYVQPDRKDKSRWHLFAIDETEQVMPGCSIYYPSNILTCSIEFGC